MRVDTISGGEYATTVHLGSYDGLGDAWSHFVNEANAKLGRKASNSAAFEIYRDDCSKVPIEEVRTDLYLP